MCTFYGRLEKVKDPKTAFFYLLDNVAGQNSGKFIESRSARGEYYWVERSRGEDQCYFIVRKRGNNITVIRRRWLIGGKGTNLFLGSLVGFDKEPVPEDTVVLVHPIMDVIRFKQAYAKATPELEHWTD